MDLLVAAKQEIEGLHSGKGPGLSRFVQGADPTSSAVPGLREARNGGVPSIRRRA